jgi:TonB-like protein
MRRSVAAFLAWTALTAAADPSPPVPTHADDPSKWGRLDRVFAPEYPKEALDKGISGSVEIDGIVTGWRTLSDVKLRPEGASSAVFVKAVEEAIPHWRLFPPLGNDCMPSNARVTTRAVFEIQDGKPRIFVEHAALERSGAPPVQFNPIRRVQPKYPKRILQAEIEAIVYALLEVNPSGEVTEVRTRTFPRYKGLILPAEHRNYREVSIAFDADVAEAARRWEYSPAAVGGEQRRANCVTFIYRIRD